MKKKNYKSLYTVARSALGKIAGDALVQSKTDGVDLNEELINTVKEFLKNPVAVTVNVGETAKPAETVEPKADEQATPAETTGGKAEYVPLAVKIEEVNSQEVLEKLKRHQTRRYLYDFTDWQATVKQMQSFASTVLALLDETERGV